MDVKFIVNPLAYMMMDSWESIFECNTCRLCRQYPRSLSLLDVNSKFFGTQPEEALQILNQILLLCVPFREGLQ